LLPREDTLLAGSEEVATEVSRPVLVTTPHAHFRDIPAATQRNASVHRA
jgi:hypothetical protein